MQTTYVSPETLITGASPEARLLSPDAADIVARIKAHYKEQGKTAAAAHYSRHLKALFSWSEAQGYSIRSLPADAVENFLSALKSAGQTDTTLYVTRTQLKAALVACQNLFGLEVGHVEYVTGRPKEVTAQVKANAQAKKAAARAKTDKSKARAVAAAQSAVYGVPPPPAPIPVAQYAPMDTHIGQMPPTPVETFPEDVPMTTPLQSAVPDPIPAAAPVAAPAVQPQVIVVQQPAQVPGGANGVRATIGAPAAAQKAAVGASPPQTRGIVINNHTFTGAFVKISYVADGSNPFTPPGTETYVTTMPASQLAPHGDLGAFLQTFIIPSMRLSPTTSQVQFVFHELNDRRVPTGRRDELVVGIPLGPLGQQSAMPAQNGPLNGLSFSSPAPSQQDSATAYLLKKLDDEAAEAKKRAEEYQVQMREAKDAQTTFMLMQAFQKEQDLRKELEEKREREAARLAAPPPVMTAPPPPMPIMPPMPMFTPEPPRPPDTSLTDALRAISDTNAKTLEVLAAAMRPQPVPAQKDVSEWLVPFMAQLNQQSQAQAQAQQQMMLTLMQTQQTAQQQATQQMMQLMMGKESSVEKILMMQLQEVKAAASAPKEDELESFADKLQKMKMVSDMMGGGGGGSMLTELLANADTIGAGIAKVVDSAKGNAVGLGSAPTQQVQDQQRQLAGAPAAAKALPPGEMPPPSDVVMAAHKALAEVVEKRDDEETAKAFLEFLKQMLTAQEPYASMGRRLMTAYQQAEDEGELYTLAKNLWIVVGEKPTRPQAKYVARVLAEFYSDLHQSIFGEARTLPEDEEAEEDAGTDEESAA